MKLQVLLAVVLIFKHHRCNAITNTNSNFNANIRAYSEGEDHGNGTDIKTLQRKPLGRQEEYSPIHTTGIQFKEIPDSALSSSSRGLSAHYEHPVYTINDYEDKPNFNHGSEYQLYEHELQHHQVHLDPHEYHHVPSGHHYPGPHHISYGHHHKHYNHALAAKTILWPIAGIALLGAAAALVSNPVLLQLGVISGKRRRRDTKSSPELAPDFIKKPTFLRDKTEPLKPSSKVYGDKSKEIQRLNLTTKKRGARRIKHEITVPDKMPNSNRNDDDGYIPIPLKIRIPN